MLDTLERKNHSREQEEEILENEIVRDKELKAETSQITQDFVLGASKSLKHLIGSQIVKGLYTIKEERIKRDIKA